MKYNLAILDDEPLSLEASKGIISDYFKDIHITLVFSNPLEALKTLSVKPCDILLCDIRMPGMNGIEFAQTLKSAHSPHIVFLTGYDEYAIQAIQEGAFDYILKPLSPLNFRETLNRIQAKERSAQVGQTFAAHFDRLLINRNDKTLLLDFADINRLYANGPYTHVYLTNDEQIVATKPLKYYQQVLQGKGFIRPHRSHLFNARNILEIRKDADGNGILYFRKGKEVFISQDCKNQLAHLLGIMQQGGITE